MGTFDYFRGEKSLFMHWDKDLIMSLINLEYLVIMFYSIWCLKILLLLFYTHTHKHTQNGYALNFLTQQVNQQSIKK